MKQPEIFSATLGLSHPWQIKNIIFSKDKRRIDITIDFLCGSTFTCPTCGTNGTTCKVEDEVWYHDDFFRYAAYLYARVPHIACACCGITPVSRPWTHAGSRFTLTE